jgi:hypothetical protein
MNKKDFLAKGKFRRTRDLAQTTAARGTEEPKIQG